MKEERMLKTLRATLALVFLLYSVAPSLAAFNSNTAPIDCSGTIAVGGTAQNAFAANQFLNGFMIANIDTSEVMWISFTGTAAAGIQGSYPLAPATATTYAGLSSFFGSVGFN